jgi:TonB-linked SusC/RagA family outer membrane protein
MTRARALAGALLGLCLTVPIAGRAQAQNAVITGKVTSEFGQPLEGANVYITELSVSIGTNAQGQYSISIPAARVTGQQVILRVRSFGFLPQMRPISLTAGSQTVDFALKQDVNRLAEVVVTGVAAGTEQKKLAFTVAHVDESQMPVPGANPLSQLQGKISGVSVMQTSGRPGRAPDVLLRGPQSINGAGRGQSPLYIVDGIAISGNLPDLNPQDIESVEVVKGAAASSLYGSRAGNGVIQITTKSGKNAGDGVRFSGRFEYGGGDIEKEYAWAHAHTMQMTEDGKKFCVKGTNCTVAIDFYEEARRVNEDAGDFALAPTNFERDMGIGAAPTRPQLRGVYMVGQWPVSYNPIAQTVTNGLNSNATVDATGRVGGLNFFASANSFQQEGSIRYIPGYTRNSIRVNLDQAVGDNWTLSLRSFYSNSEANGEDHDDGGTGFFRLTRQPAGVDLEKRDNLGRLYIRSNPLNQGGQNQNPLYLFESWVSQRDRDRFLGNFSTKYTPTSWAELSSDVSYDRGTFRYYFLQDLGYRTTSSSSANQGFIQRSSGTTTAYNANVNGSAHANILSDLFARVTGGYLYEQQDGLGEDAWGSKLAAPGLGTLDAVSDQNSKAVGSNLSSIRSIGVRGGLDLEYKERYIFGALIRRDGSSLFGSDNRWATYGRGSFAWRLSDEPWWIAPRAVNDLKLRASVGSAGGRPRFSAQYETFSIGAGGTLSTQAMGNKKLRPEYVLETEYGVDAELFQRFGVTLNYARSISSSQILPVSPSAATGFTTTWINAGTLENKTWEASLNVPIIQRRNLSWSTRLNWDRNRAYVTALNVPEFFLGTSQQGAGALYKIAVGERYGNFYGRDYVRSCGQLPSQYQSQCGGASSEFQKNNDGYIVWVGAGNTLGEGITKNLWQAGLIGCRSSTGAAINVVGEVACAAAGGTVTAPWGASVNWGTPMIIRDSTGAAKQSLLGNALPDFRLSLSNSFNYKKLFVYGLLDGNFGRKVFNEGRHWSLGDFMTGEEDQLGKTVETAKPVGYYWRNGPADNGAGIGGLYDQLAPSGSTVESASYLKIREASVGYNVGPVRGIGDWTVTVIGRNLKTFTKYHGFDPEVGFASGGNNNSGSSQLNALDAYTFPNLRTVTVSLSTRF